MNKGMSEMVVKRLLKRLLILLCGALSVFALAACTGLMPVTDNRVQAASASDATPAPAVEPAVTAADAPLRQPLVTCNEEDDAGQACWMIATEPAHLVGIWKQYMGNPRIKAPNGMAFIQYRLDGTYSVADTPENTDAPLGIYPHGTYRFEDGTLTILVENVPPECAGPAVLEVRVLQVDGRPIGLRYYPIKDDCAPRRADFTELLLWVGDLSAQAMAR